jgi:cAMP-dependent protein kinase regulator
MQAVAVIDGDVVMTYGDGDYFGELALRSSQPRAATVQADGFMTILRLDQASFNQLVVDKDDIGTQLEQQYAKYGTVRRRRRCRATA